MYLKYLISTHLKTHKKTEIENLLNLIKKKSTYNLPATILNGEKLVSSSLTWGTKIGCPLSPHLFNTAVDIPANAICQGKEIKDVQTRKENCPYFAS